MAAGRFNSCANRAYDACFQTALAAPIREGIQPDGRDRRWGRPAVESRFVGRLVNRRHRFPPTLRATLAQSRELRGRADYDLEGVTPVQVGLGVHRAREFVRTVRLGGASR